MKRFKNIGVLLGETGEDVRILGRAQALALSNQAAISVYATLDKSSIDDDRNVAMMAPDDLVKRVAEVKEERLAEATRPLREAGISVSENLLTGKPFIRVVQEVLRNNHDLLMVPAEKEHPSFALFFGGTPMHLLRKCPCPVWVFRAQRKRKFHRVLAAVNLASQRAEENALNVQVMELATSLAEQEDTELHVVFCWTAFGESMMVHMGGLLGEDLQSYVRDAKGEYENQMQNFLLGFPIDKQRTHTHLLKGEAGSLIPGFVVKRGIELLVMGTVARSGIPGLFMGNTAEKVLNHVPCSVLAVKPDGFVSPVHLDRS